MEVKVEITKEQFIAFNKSSIKGAYKRILLICVCFAIILAIIDGVQHDFKYPDTIESFLISFFIILLLIIIILGIRIYKVLKKIKVHNSLISIYTLYPEGIKLEKENVLLYFRWPEIRKVSLTALYMFITLNKGTTYAIPLHAFENKEQETTFFNVVQDGIASGKLTLPKRPSYWIGLLGFLPAIGLINGLIMLIKGLTTYRDKKYALIGLTGILFSWALFYIADNHIMFHMPKVLRETFVESEPMYLNSIVKEIEFYKLQHGVYPDSLNEIKPGAFTIMSDPMIDGQKNSAFNYHKIGNKYTLFSSGVDEIPNTADDIYPTVDTTNTGLIVKRR